MFELKEFRKRFCLLSYFRFLESRTVNSNMEGYLKLHFLV